MTLCYIRAEPSKWKTYFASRVSKIQQVVPVENWGYVPGKENPADCATGGITPQELINHSLWWTGPKWLQEIPKPTVPQNITLSTNKQIRKFPCLHTTNLQLGTMGFSF